MTSVAVLDHYKLRVSFSDGLVRDVDLSDLRGGGPIFEPLRDPSFFGRVRVDPLVLHGDAPPAVTPEIR